MQEAWGVPQSWLGGCPSPNGSYPSPGCRRYVPLPQSFPGQGVPQSCPGQGGTPVLSWSRGVLCPEVPPWLMVPTQPGLGYPQEGHGTRDLGKNQGMAYCQKGPGTRDLGKNLGLGYPPRKDLGSDELSHHNAFVIKIQLYWRCILLFFGFLLSQSVSFLMYTAFLLHLHCFASLISLLGRL